MKPDWANGCVGTAWITMFAFMGCPSCSRTVLVAALVLHGFNRCLWTSRPDIAHVPVGTFNLPIFHGIQNLKLRPLFARVLLPASPIGRMQAAGYVVE
jgi:hypothetical protein